MMTVFMMNFFVAILNDSFTEAREMLEAEPREDNEMANFMGEYAKELLKEISQELRVAIEGRGKTYQPNGDRASREDTRDRDYFLY